MTMPQNQGPGPDGNASAWAQWSGPPPAGTAPYFSTDYSWANLQPPPTRRRTGLIIGLCVAAAVAAIAVALASTGLLSGTGGTVSRSGAKASHAAAIHTVKLPAAAAGFKRTTGNVGRRLVASIRRRAEKSAAAGSPAWPRVFAKAKIGIYTKQGAGALVVMAFSVRGTRLIASILRSHTASEVLDSFFLGARISSTKDFRPGRLGGVLRCGRSTRGPYRGTLCAWDDKSVLGVLVQDGAPKARLARTARAFHAAAEH
ncbi:MAG: hypothetical protein ACTHJW_05360 [Streptosporangiaceae bacterium]